MFTTSSPSELLPDHSPFARLAPDSHQQCLLLFESLFDKVLQCLHLHSQQKWSEFGFHLGRSTAILDHLHERLDFTGETGLAVHFAKIYRHADSQLQQAALHADAEALTEAERVLRIAYECARDLLDLAQNERPHDRRLQ